MNVLCAVLRHFSLTEAENEENLTIMCQFHSDTNPSMSVNERMFHCWSCDAKGSFLQLVSQLEMEERRKVNQDVYPLNDFEIYRLIARIKKDKNVKSHDTLQNTPTKYSQDESLLYAERFLSSLRMPTWNVLDFHPFISKKGFSPITLHDHGVRINQQSTYSTVMPIIQNDVLKGYTTRIWGDDLKPKYKHSPGFTKGTVIGGNLRKGSVLIVEGYTDMMKSHQYNWDNVACLFGWHCSQQQRDFILMYATSIIDGLDEDEMGRKGGKQLIELFGDRRPIYRLPISQVEKDPCGMTSESFKRSIHNLELLRR